MHSRIARRDDLRIIDSLVQARRTGGNRCCAARAPAVHLLPSSIGQQLMCGGGITLDNNVMVRTCQNAASNDAAPTCSKFPPLSQ